MFSDYLLGDESTATITANEDGTINLVYKSGSGDFTLNNLKLSSNKSFSGSGEVAMSMGGSTGGSYDYTLEGSVDGSKVLSLKANVDIPVPMGKMEIDFIQGETPVGYYIKDTYKYQTNLSLKVQGGEVGSTTDCQVKIENPTGSTVNVTISGFNNAGGSMSNFEKFTVTGVNVTKANNGSYSLSLGAFEADTQKTTGEALAINGTSLNGTINADGTPLLVSFSHREVCQCQLQQNLREVILKVAHNKRLNSNEKKQERYFQIYYSTGSGNVALCL